MLNLPPGDAKKPLVLLDANEVNESKVVLPTTMTHVHDEGHFGVKFVPLRFNEAVRTNFIRIMWYETLKYTQDGSGIASICDASMLSIVGEIIPALRGAV